MLSGIDSFDRRAALVAGPGVCLPNVRRSTANAGGSLLKTFITQSERMNADMQILSPSKGKTSLHDINVLRLLNEISIAFGFCDVCVIGEKLFKWTTNLTPQKGSHSSHLAFASHIVTTDFNTDIHKM